MKTVTSVGLLAPLSGLCALLAAYACASGSSGRLPAVETVRRQQWSLPSATTRTAMVGAAGIGSALVAGGPLPGLAAVLLGSSVLAGSRCAERRRLAARARASWREALAVFAAALRAGLPLHAALAAASTAADAPVELRTASALAAAGAEPGAGLGDTAAGRRLSACLRLADLVGAAPATIAARLVDGLTADEHAVREARLALASTAATARLLAALPVGGVLLAAAFGASAPTFLLRNAAGHGCLLGAAVLESAGLWWLRKLTGEALEP